MSAATISTATSNNGEPVVEFRGVSRSYSIGTGRVTGLTGADLSIARGEFLAVTGPSGSGKTTLLNLATLLDRPSTGSLHFAGRDVAALSDAQVCALRGQAIGIVFQACHLLPAWSVLDNVLLRFRYLDMDRSQARALALAALAAVGLAALARRPARLLSGGEMQRVAIARAIASRPVLLAADEPTGNLDSVAAGAVLECLHALHREGLAILLVTHNPALLAYCERHIECRDGTLSEARH